MDSLSEFIDFDIYECENEQRGAEEIFHQSARL
jgi:hypothetical protein